MSDFDRDVSEVLSVLAAIVNRAGRSEPTSAAAVGVSKVPTALLVKAKEALERFGDSEFGTEAIRQACKRKVD